MAGAERFEDLVVWQLAHELGVTVWKATTGWRDFKLRDQIRDASDSAHRNIAEGFGRYDPPQFLYHLNVARASTEETRSLLIKGRAIGYLSDDTFRGLHTMAERQLQAIARFQRYLRSPRARRNAEIARHRRNARQARIPNASNPNDPKDPKPNDSNDSNDSDA